MQKTNLSFLIGIIILLSSCNTYIKTYNQKTLTAVKATDPFYIYNERDTIPYKSEFLGAVKIGDTGFTVNCSYDTVLNQACRAARNIGGNSIKIIEHRLPSIFGSTCHQLKADIYYIDNNYITSKKPVTPAKSTSQSALSREKYLPFRFAFSSGFGYQLAGSINTGNNNLDSYYKKMKWGFVYSVDASYLVSYNMGLGVYYNTLSTSNSANLMELQDQNGVYYYTSLYDDMKVSFVGPKFYFRQADTKNLNTFNFGISLGYLSMKSYSEILTMKFHQTGATTGVNYEISYDRKLSKNISVGFNLSALSGVLTSYTVDYGSYAEKISIQDPKEYIGLGRVDFSVGLRILFGNAK